MEYSDLREMIHRNIVSLHGPGREIHWLYRRSEFFPPVLKALTLVAFSRYFNAPTWPDIVSAMTQSAFDMKDELIALRDDRAGELPLAHHLGIRQTDVQNSEDLDQVFGADIFTKSILLYGTSTTVDQNPGDPGQAVHTDVPETFVFSSSQDDTEVLVQPIDVTEHEEEIATFNKAQLAAAEVFQLAYHRLLLRRGKEDEGPLAIKRNRLFLECLSAAERIQWERRHYRYLFLGPLPHLLLCLEKANNHAYNVKNRLKKRINTAHHRDLDEARAKMTEIKWVLLFILFSLPTDGLKLLTAMSSKSATASKRFSSHLPHFMSVKTRMSLGFS